jgi:hypothetical protein
MVNCTFEYFENTLKKESIKRKKNRQPFTELELTRLVYDVIEGYAALQREAIRPVEINQSLIFISEDTVMKLGRAKVIERMHYSKDQRAGLIHNISTGSDIFIDPYVYTNLFCNNQSAMTGITNEHK